MKFLLFLHLCIYHAYHQRKSIASIKTIRFSFIIFIMNIDLSKQSKIVISNNRPLASCSLLDFGIVKQKVIYRKRSLSKRNSNNKQRSKSTNGLQLFKTLTNTDYSTKSNSTKQEQKHRQSILDQKVRTQVMQNTQFLAPKQNIIKEEINEIRSRIDTEYHGSWGIPKYSNQSPTKATLEWKPVGKARNVNYPDKFNIKIQPQSISNKYKLQYSTPFKFNTSRTSERENFRLEKSRLQAMKTNNPQMPMQLSVRSIQRSIALTPSQSQTLFVPYTPPGQILKSHLSIFPSTNSGLHASISSIQQIEGLQDIREVRSHYSRELNGSKMQDKTLNQSLVIGNDVNSSGFWK